MTRSSIHRLRFLIPLVFYLSAMAGAATAAPSELSKEQAIEIIATLEELHPRHYQIIHLMDGSLERKDGFRHQSAKRVQFFGPKDHRDTRRVLRSCTLLHSAEYGWFLQRSAEDARGHYLEISSQTKGRIFIR
ncbi:hypothetical protein HW115_14245 [Verrucomicrobiaceae bacterium N1E253]|uniref:WYL domain-containing protein n=1 Tax=Oceaniferula marina TaxID=2748318 RepID=A0A851GHV5_9BACT|nr:hypothetical protein [Oceaniferula marina]NWK56779.1 hypothetical protein [Oceaniferula marina]